VESKQMLEEQLGAPLQRLDDCPTSTSKNYGLPGFKGSIGFISSMSDHFCGGCNRVRITADGNLKICLFDNREINLKTMID
jgi:molybdenum cofactor biosynthesis enzyme MoaA